MGTLAKSVDTDEMWHFIRVCTVCRGVKLIFLLTSLATYSLALKD